MNRSTDESAWAPLALAPQNPDGSTAGVPVVDQPCASETVRPPRFRWRWRWQISLRTWFVALTLCCVALASLGRYCFHAEEQRRTVQELRRMGCSVDYESAHWLPRWLLSRLPYAVPADYLHRVQSVALSPRSASAASVAAINRLPSCRVLLDVRGDDPLPSAAALVSLRRPLELTLDVGQPDRRLESKDLEALCRLPVLRELSVWGEPFDDQCMHSLAHATNLERLELNSIAVTGAGVAELAALPRLRSLSLHQGTSRLAAAAFLPALEELGISRANEELAAGLRWLALSKSLRKISIPIASMGREEGRALAAIPNLERIYVEELGDGAGFVAELASAPHLRVLHAMYGADSKMLEQLPRLPQLRELEIYAAEPNANLDEGAHALARCPKLEVLAIRQGLSDAGVAALAAAPRLRNLHAGGDITNAGARALLQNTNLRELTLTSRMIDNSVAADFALATHLKALDLRGAAISDAQLHWIADRLPGCRCHAVRFICRSGRYSQ